MSDQCGYCLGVRLVGWSGAGPILCPECSRGADAFTVITQAWREQRAENVAMRKMLSDAVKYAREDRAYTPGSTRLARLILRAARYLGIPDRCVVCERDRPCACGPHEVQP